MMALWHNFGRLSDLEQFLGLLSELVAQIELILFSLVLYFPSDVICYPTRWVCDNFEIGHFWGGWFFLRANLGVLKLFLRVLTSWEMGGPPFGTKSQLCP